MNSELLVQTLAGIRSVLDEQGAELIGGHRWSRAAPLPCRQALGADHPHGERQQQHTTLAETGLQPGDALLIVGPWAPGCVCRGHDRRHQR